MVCCCKSPAALRRILPWRMISYKMEVVLYYWLSPIYLHYDRHSYGRKEALSRPQHKTHPLNSWREAGCPCVWSRHQPAGHFLHRAERNHWWKSLDRVTEIMKIPAEAIKNFSEDAAATIIANMFSSSDTSTSASDHPFWLWSCPSLHSNSPELPCVSAPCCALFVHRNAHIQRRLTIAHAVCPHVEEHTETVFAFHACSFMR